MSLYLSKFILRWPTTNIPDIGVIKWVMIAHDNNFAIYFIYEWLGNCFIKNNARYQIILLNPNDIQFPPSFEQFFFCLTSKYKIATSKLSASNIGVTYWGKSFEFAPEKILILALPASLSKLYRNFAYVFCECYNTKNYYSVLSNRFLNRFSRIRLSVFTMVQITYCFVYVLRKRSYFNIIHWNFTNEIAFQNHNESFNLAISDYVF